MSVPSLGFFIDGTRADWDGRDGKPTAVKRLYLRYVGPREYVGGPGSDDSTRGWLIRLHDTLTGAGRKARLAVLGRALDEWSPECVDVGGWSRGGDDAIAACEYCRARGVPVRFLFLIDPVPAFGWRAALRLIPFAPIERFYPPIVNVVGGIAQVLAGDEYSRLLRHARVQDVPSYYVAGDHSDSGWRSMETDRFIVSEGRRYGLLWPAA